MNIVKVQYFSGGFQETGGREYTYYSEDSLKVGDMVIVPVRDTTGKAKVSAIDVPEAEIASFKDKVKTIPAGSIVPAQGSLSDAALAAGAEVTEATVTVKLAGYWWCEKCQEEKVWQNVTHGENCVQCGYPVIWKTLNPSTAIINISPESDLVILSLLAHANALRDIAEARVIANDTDLESAVNDLSIIANVKKSLIAKKAEYYKPIKAHLDAITAMFGTLLTPIEDADRITRAKYTAYTDEQKRRAREAEEINRQKQELARREAELNEGIITVDTASVEVPMPVNKVRTDMGTAQTIKVRKYRVINFALLPDQYKIENSALLNKVVKAGIPEIDGVEIYIDEGLRVSPTR